MLSTLITTLQSSLLASRSYLFGSFLPVLLVFLGSVAVAATAFPRAQALLAQVVAEKMVATTTWTLLLLVVVAYAFSVVVDPLRRILEDVPRWLGGLRNRLLSLQIAAAEKARRDLERYQGLYWELVEAGWIGRLREARRQGSKKDPPQRQAGGTDALAQVSHDILQLEEKKNALKDLLPSELKPVIEHLETLLGSCSANAETPASLELSALHEDAHDLLRYVEGRLQTERLRAFEEYAEFPDSIAPTRMGNLAGTLRSYAQTRYGMPLDILWTRFQRVLQSDEKLNGTLQDAKVQLDFLVSLTWLAGAFTLVWTVILAFCSRSLVTFVGVSVLGPIGVVLLYKLACRAYRTFAEVMRGAVDLHRFDLLVDLRLPLPSFPDQERGSWQMVSEWLGRGNAPGGIHYRHKS